MSNATRLALSLCLSSVIASAGTFSGSLVDSKCFAAEERNVNPTDTQTSVDRDQNLEVRYCAPRAKTKSFAVIAPDGTIYALDAAGNLKAAALVRNAGKKSRLAVAVNGELNRNTIQVDSISALR